MDEKNISVLEYDRWTSTMPTIESNVLIWAVYCRDYESDDLGEMGNPLFHVVARNVTEAVEVAQAMQELGDDPIVQVRAIVHGGIYVHPDIHCVAFRDLKAFREARKTK